MKMKNTINKLIQILEGYKFKFNEDEVKCELFNLLKKEGSIVRAEYTVGIEDNENPRRHDLVILNNKFEIINPIEIKSRVKNSLKRAKRMIFKDGDNYGECESIFRTREDKGITDGTVIFINIIENKEKSIIEGLKQIDIENEICEEYDFITVYYLEFVFTEKISFNGGVIIRNKEIAPVL